MICGIDPGNSGALAFLEPRTGEWDIIPMPVLTVGKPYKNPPKRDEDGKVIRRRPAVKKMLDVPAIRTILIEKIRQARINGLVVFIEKANSMPKQGVTAIAHYMLGYGQIIGLLVGLFIPYTEVTPQAWKKVMMAGMGKEKSQSCIRANQLFPALSLKKGEDGKADAVLLAAYGQRVG